MFGQAIQASEAMRQAERLGAGKLLPALSGCRSCGMVQMIAAPALDVCPRCATPLRILGPDETEAFKAHSKIVAV